MNETTLNSHKIAEVDAYIDSFNQPEIIKPALVVKMSLLGYKNREIAEALEAKNINKICEWKKIYKTQGLDGLKRHVSYYLAKKVEGICKYEWEEICQHLKTKDSWSIREFKQFLSYSYGVEYPYDSYYGKLLTQAGIKPRGNQAYHAGSSSSF